MDNAEGVITSVEIGDDVQAQASEADTPKQTTTPGRKWGIWPPIVRSSEAPLTRYTSFPEPRFAGETRRKSWVVGLARSASTRLSKMWGASAGEGHDGEDGGKRDLLGRKPVGKRERERFRMGGKEDRKDSIGERLVMVGKSGKWKRTKEGEADIGVQEVEEILGGDMVDEEGGGRRMSLVIRVETGWERESEGPPRLPELPGGLGEGKMSLYRESGTGSVRGSVRGGDGESVR